MAVLLHALLNVFIAKDPGPVAQASLGLKGPQWALPELSGKDLGIGHGDGDGSSTVMVLSKESWLPLVWGLWSSLRWAPPGEERQGPQQPGDRKTPRIYIAAHPQEVYRADTTDTYRAAILPLSHFGSAAVATPNDTEFHSSRVRFLFGFERGECPGERQEHLCPGALLLGREVLSEPLLGNRGL
ncbi:hypothetical protein GRJ2_001940100 [Grus japonensis]|uniref:Uncharacterized protein n=1 Tax=Grus japonensis TaxID=30415 RepID=A0ABC9XAP2_GRUJA